jgi:hypothetical protein
MEAGRSRPLLWPEISVDHRAAAVRLSCRPKHPGGVAARRDALPIPSTEDRTAKRRWARACAAAAGTPGDDRAPRWCPPFVAKGGLGHAGPYIGRDLFGGAFTFDPWELYAAGHLTNPNILVIGHVGEGKSSLVKTLLWRSSVFGRSARPQVYSTNLDTSDLGNLARSNSCLRPTAPNWSARWPSSRRSSPADTRAAVELAYLPSPGLVVAAGRLDGQFSGVKDLQHGGLAHAERECDGAHRLAAFVSRCHVPG